MHPRELKAAFDRGENITQLLRQQQEHNTEEIIELAYDLQTGTYVEAQPAMVARNQAFGEEIVEIFSELQLPASLLEAGIGEGTTLSHVLDALPNADQRTVAGIDISWSRLGCARAWLKSRQHHNVQLCVASLFHLPFADNSFDIVYTAHAVEPNGGQEQAILAELHRVASRHVVLLEPGYELAPAEARERMDRHGYCKNLVGHAEALNMNVLRHELIKHPANPMNPTAVTVIEKSASAPSVQPVFACPWYQTPLTTFADCLFSEEAMRAYPILGGIPCLRRETSIIASKYPDYTDQPDSGR